jgi:hypothetical protein
MLYLNEICNKMRAFFCAIISGMWVDNQFVIPIYANNLEYLTSRRVKLFLSGAVKYRKQLKIIIKNLMI